MGWVRTIFSAGLLVVGGTPSLARAQTPPLLRCEAHPSHARKQVPGPHDLFHPYIVYVLDSKYRPGQLFSNSVGCSRYRYTNDVAAMPPEKKITACGYRMTNPDGAEISVSESRLPEGEYAPYRGMGVEYSIPLAGSSGKYRIEAWMEGPGMAKATSHWEFTVGGEPLKELELNACPEFAPAPRTKKRR